MDKKRKKTVLILSVKWPPESFIWQTVKGLADSGFKVILGVSLEKNQKPADSNPRINFLKLPQWETGFVDRAVNFTILFLKALRDPIGLLRLFKVLAVHPIPSQNFFQEIKQVYKALPFVGLKPDLIHFQWNSLAVEYEYLWGYYKVPVIVSCRGSQINSAPWNPTRADFRKSLQTTLMRAAAVHCVSEAIKNEALQYKLDPAKARVIRPAVDTGFFFSKPKSQSGELPLKIISVGNLIWIKGFESALIAMRKLLDAGINFQYEIIGEGPDRQRLLYTIHDLNLQDNVRLTGKLSREAVRDRLYSADIYLLSSLAEGISNSVLEAMACGLAVVSTDCGGMREVITDNLEGLIVPVNDSAAMSSALQRLASDIALRERVGAAGRKRVVENFSSVEQAKVFSGFYKELITP